MDRSVRLRDASIAGICSGARFHPRGAVILRDLADVALKRSAPERIPI